METDVKKFDTKVQRLKYKVLREVARSAWKGTLAEDAIGIPKIIVPGKIPTMRCCVYKERAILAERVKIAMGGDKDNPNVIETIDIACDECPVNGYEVSSACRGCHPTGRRRARGPPRSGAGFRPPGSPRDGASAGSRRPAPAFPPPVRSEPEPA